MFETSFVNGSGFSSEDYQEMSNAWVNIQDDELMIDANVYKELNKLYDTCMEIYDENNGKYKEDYGKDEK